MKRIVWTFGLISGAVISVLMASSILIVDKLGLQHSMYIGYATMVAAFAMIWFGVRTYRDNVLGGSIGFGRAFSTGLLITLISSSCYVATWEVLYHTVLPDFADKYAVQVLKEATAAGKPAAEIEQTRVKMEEFKTMYANPFYNVGMTFLEPLPVGILVALVTAGVLSRKRKVMGAPGREPATTT